MEGLDHKGFAVAGAMTVTSLVYDLTPKLGSGTMANVLHPEGVPWTWPYLVHNGLHLDSIETVVMKVVFYLVLVQLASLPDRLERRKAGDFGIPSKHRGFTHSCFFLALLILMGSMVSVVGWQFLVSHHVVLDPEVTKFLTTVGVAVFLAAAMHILADSLTKKGVRAFWPDNTLVGVLPEEMRFTNKSAGPSLVLWGMYFIAGALFALGIVGF